MVRRRFPLLKFLVTAAILLVVVILLRNLWLPLLGYALVHDDGPAKADIAVVLGGDYYGRRIEKGAELVRAGYVPAVLVSGPPGFYGLHEDDLALPFIEREGYPAAWFIPFRNDGLSTYEEAHLILLELRRRGVHSFLLITSDYHTARARRIYVRVQRELGTALPMRVVAAPDEFFHAASWWRNRESQKTTFNEWVKTFAAVVGL